MVTNKDLNFSLFYDPSKGIYTTEPKQEIDFNRLIEIYNSDLVKDITSKIRVADEKTQKTLKKSLPFITPFGTFTPTRQNVNMKTFNDSIVCLDIDGLKEHEVHFVKFILTSNESTLLCAISPRGRGVKAFVLINDTIPLKNCYNALKLNKNHIAEKLNLLQFVNRIDNAQFKPTQPWFIGHDPEMYVNGNAIPLAIQLIPYIEPVYVDEPVNFYLIDEVQKRQYQMNGNNKRVEIYFQNATESLVKFFAVCAEGNRHANIVKVQTIASWIHYAPELEQEIKSKLYNACLAMYGSEKEALANNVHKSFERAWSKAPIRQNKTIETILEESIYSLRINKFNTRTL